MREELVRDFLRIVGSSATAWRDHAHALACVLRQIATPESNLGSEARASAAEILSCLLRDTPELASDVDVSLLSSLASDANEAVLQGGLSMIETLLGVQRIGIKDVVEPLGRIEQHPSTALKRRILRVYQSRFDRDFDEIPIDRLILLYSVEVLQDEFKDLRLVDHLAESLSLPRSSALAVLQGLTCLVEASDNGLRVSIPLKWCHDQMSTGWFLSPAQLARADGRISSLSAAQVKQLAVVLTALSQCPQ